MAAQGRNSLSLRKVPRLLASMVAFFVFASLLPSLAFADNPLPVPSIPGLPPVPTLQPTTVPIQDVLAALPPALTPAQHEPVPAWRPKLVKERPLGLPDGVSAPNVVDGLRERFAKDTPTASVYRFGGGDHAVDLSTAAQNYQDSTGTWHDIDPTLIASGDGFRNTAGPVGILFPSHLDAANPVRLDLAGGTLTFVPTGASADAAVGPEGTTVAYASALPGTDFRYTSLASGYEEQVVLAARPESDRSSWDVVATGLTLRAEDSGEISILSGANVVGIIPRPLVSDSKIDPATGLGAVSEGFTYELAESGLSTYRLDVVYDQAWLDDPARQYPVTIDPSPQTRDIGNTADTYVNECTSFNYGGSTEIQVGFTSGPACDHRSLVNFDTSIYARTDRVVYVADLYVNRLFGGSDNVKARYPAGSWSEFGTTWPGPGPTGPSYNVVQFQGLDTWDVGGIYAHVLGDINPWAARGVHLEAANFHRYSSRESGTSPRLLLIFDDLPEATTPLAPDNGATIESGSPVLQVDAMPTDFNGDDTWLQFQVSTAGDTATFADHLVVSSDYMDSTRWGVDGGYLKDGVTYYWRAVSYDVCHDDNSGDDYPCGNEDADHQVHSRAKSAIRSFTVALPHYGTDERWAMWDRNLGNGVGLHVNMANGNVYLDHPIDALASPPGPLGISLTYNSQLQENLGMGPGWNVGAGPLSDATKLPVSLKLLDDVASGHIDVVRVKYADGDRAYFPHQNGQTYRGGGAGAGILTRSPEDPGKTWTLLTRTGARYVFDSGGKLVKARPTSDDWTHQGFDYSFADDAGRLQLTSVTDPLARVVGFGWTGSTGARQLTSISTWDSRTWHISYWTDGRLAAVQDPKGDVVVYAYDATSGLLANMWDGEALTASPVGPPTTIGYGSGSPVRVSSVMAPGSSNPTVFGYGAVLNGSIVNNSAVWDPRGYPTSDPNDYATGVIFNTQGFPIERFGPYALEGATPVWPVVTEVWDTNGNLVCSRNATANALALGCTADATSNTLNAEYTYQHQAPYQVLTAQGSAPNADGTGTRALSTYRYDEGFQGLKTERYENENLAGVPDSEAVGETIDFAWASGYPSGINNASTWSLRFSGEITAANSRQWSFRLTSDDGARLVIGQKVVVDCWTPLEQGVQTNCGQGAKTKWLTAGNSSPISLEYRHGAAATGPNPQLKLEWKQQDGDWVVVPLGRLSPNLDLETSMDDPLGTTTTAYPTDRAKVLGLAFSQTRSGLTTSARTTIWSYDLFGRVETAADAAGTVTTHYSATTGCVDWRTDRTGALTEFTCNGAGDILTVVTHVPAVPGTDQSANQDREVTTTYDGLGRVLTLSVAHPVGVTASPACTAPVPCTKTTYDHAGRILSVADPVGFVTSYQRDVQGRITVETKPDPDLDPVTSTNGPLLSPVIHRHYDEVGNETSTEDARTKTWSSSFDAQNRVLTSTDPTTATTFYAYGLASRTTTVTDAAGVSRRTTSDLLGRKVSGALGALPPTTYEYDAVGNVTRVNYPSPAPKVYVESTYNAFGQVTKETRPTGTGGAAKSIDYGYDGAGRQITRKDQREYITSYGYDNEGRLTTVTLPASLGIWSFAYDAAGERVKATDGENRTRFWSHDVRGRQTTYRDAAGTTTNTFDEDGRLVRVDDPRPRSERFVYDALGRRTRRYGVTVPSGATVDSETFTFDEADNLKTAQNAGYTTTINYDDAGRLKDVMESGLDSHFTYVNGQLTARSDPSGTLSFTYRSGDGLVASVTDSLSAGPTTFGYDAYGRQVTRTETGNLITSRSFDLAGRLTAQIVRKGTGGVIDSFALGYDEASNVVSKTQSVWGYTTADQGTWTYNYDQINRMGQFHPPSGNYTTYAYDKAGNRTDNWTGTTHLSTAYDGANRPTASSDGTTYTVDAIGELTAIAGPARTYTYIHDTWGRRTQATASGGKPLIQYAYDALDRTVDRAESTTTGNFHDSYGYVGLSEALAAVLGSHPTQIAQGPGGPISQKSGLLTSSVVTDLHGDMVASIDRTTGLPTGAKAYGPSGEPHGVATFNTPLGFQGDLTDPTTGFVDMGTRDYDPLIGRFTSRDALFGEPLRPTSLNQFVYAEDAPVTYTDPTGMGVSCGGFGGSGSDCQDPGVAKGPDGGGLGQGVRDNGNGHGRIDSYLWLGIQAAREKLLQALLTRLHRLEGERFGACGATSSSSGLRMGCNVQLESQFSVGAVSDSWELGIGPDGTLILFAKKRRDLKQVNDAARTVGITGSVERAKFGKFIESVKRQTGGSDFSWQELLELAREFKGGG